MLVTGFGVFKYSAAIQQRVKHGEFRSTIILGANNKYSKFVSHSERSVDERAPPANSVESITESTQAEISVPDVPTELHAISGSDASTITTTIPTSTQSKVYTPTALSSIPNATEDDICDEVASLDEHSNNGMSSEEVRRFTEYPDEEKLHVWSWSELKDRSESEFRSTAAATAKKTLRSIGLATTG